MKRYLVDETTMTALGDAVRNKINTTDVLTPSEMAEKIALIRTYEGDPVLEGVTITPTGTEIVKVPPIGVDGFGIVTVSGDPYLLPENIAEGVSIYGVTGTLVEGGIDTSDATATADDIMEGASAYVNGVLITGTHVCDGEPILSEVYVEPTGEEFSMTPEEGVDGYSTIVVAGDENLIPENIKKGATIYGVEGVLDGLELQSKTITPGTETITHTPDEGYTGFSEVTVEGDTDLLPENIKEGVEIFGVAGTLTEYDLPLTLAAVSPTAEPQLIEPAPEYGGFEKIVVAGEVNLVPGNVRSGIEIFGVVGTVEESWMFMHGCLGIDGVLNTHKPIIGTLEVVE